MAKIYEEVVIIKLSKLVKDQDDPEKIINDDTLSALEQVAQELVGSDVIAEVEVQ